MKKKANRLKAISLYTGAGGLDYGFEAAGIDTAVALEMDRDCCETLRRNREWPVIERSISEVSTADLLEAAGAKPGKIDLVIGGPPCQPFSKSSYWASGDSRRLLDPRASTLGAFLRVVREALPHAFLLENVEGLGYRGKNEGLSLIERGVAAINRETGSRYRIHAQVLDAADYGVPQHRRRMFLIASRDGTPFRFPQPTHVSTEDTLLLDLAPRHVSAWDALHDHPQEPNEDLAVRGKWAKLLPTIPEGENYLWHTERKGGLPLFGWRTRYWSFLLKLAKNQPAWTLQAQPGPATGPFHWHNRLLSAREMCRLQTFPEDVAIVGKYVSIQKQVGNAVPSLLAEVLAREIRAQLLGSPITRKRPVLAVRAPSTPTPPPERVASVPREFRKLQGTHREHPGTGRGPRAARREAVAA